MKCPHCKAQWQLPADYNIKKTKCPFCDGNLYEELQEVYTTERVLQEIVSRFGVDILLDHDELMKTFSILAPNLEKERQGLLLYYACCDIDKFLGLKTASCEVVETVRANQIEKMAIITREICDAILSAIGISRTEQEYISQTVDYEYIDIGNNTIEVTAFKGEIPSRIVFPSHIDGKQVVSIGSTILGSTKLKGAARTQVESVFIPQGVTTIGNRAFFECKALKEIILPNGLSTIGDNAFKNCKHLTNIVIPDSVSYIGCGAFSGSNIQSVVLPGNIECVPMEAFKNCKKLTNITISEGVKVIQREAFYDCKSLVKVTLPQSMFSIERKAFYGCESLCNIIFPDSINDIGYQAFSWCSLTNSKLPRSMTTIENSSFEGCNFTTMTIPEGVTQIRDYAFSDCWSLRKINIPESVMKMEDDVFFNIKSDIIIACYENSYAHEWAKKMNVAYELIEL